MFIYSLALVIILLGSSQAITPANSPANVTATPRQNQTTLTKPPTSKTIATADLSSSARTPTATVDVSSSARTPTATVDLSSSARTPTATVDLSSSARTPTATVDLSSSARTPTATVDLSSSTRTPTATADLSSSTRTPTATVDLSSSARTPTATVDLSSSARTPTATVDLSSSARTPTATVDLSSSARTLTATVDLSSSARTPKATADLFSSARTPTATVDLSSSARTPTATVDLSSSARTPTATADLSSSALTQTAAGDLSSSALINTATLDLLPLSITQTAIVNLSAHTHTRTVDTSSSAFIQSTIKRTVEPTSTTSIPPYASPIITLIPTTTETILTEATKPTTDGIAPTPTDHFLTSLFRTAIVESSTDTTTLISESLATIDPFPSSHAHLTALIPATTELISTETTSARQTTVKIATKEPTSGETTTTKQTTVKTATQGVTRTPTPTAGITTTTIPATTAIPTTTAKPTNLCQSNPCQNGGTCTDCVNSYTCQCVAGYTGQNCQTDINECLPSPCQNGGTCTDRANSYTCQCVAGYTGKNCQIDINECLPSPCQNGGTCTDCVNSYTCQCVAGYTGQNCQTDINECLPSPCQNDGNCTDKVNSYTCQCVAGYTGNNCQTDIDECESTPCLNGGTCTDLINSFECSCTKRFLEKTCETELPRPVRVELGNVTLTGFTIYIAKSGYKQIRIVVNNTEETNNITENIIFPITNLIPGTCYSVQVSTIFESKESDFIENSTCLPPDPPSSVSVFNVTSTGFSFNITHGNGIVDNFKVHIPRSSQEDYNCRSGKNSYTIVTVEGLYGGYYYSNIEIYSGSNSVESSPYHIPGQATVPYKPKQVDVIQHKPKSITFHIQTKERIIGVKFNISINDTPHVYKGEGEKTFNITVQELDPGTLYSNVTIVSVFEGLQSDIYIIKEVATSPCPPLPISIDTFNTKSITILVEQVLLNVGVSYKLIVIDGNRTIKNVAATGNTTSVLIDGLTAGRCYRSFNVIARAHDVNSSSVAVPKTCTIPNPPETVVITERTNNSFTLHVKSGSGIVESFTVYRGDLAKATANMTGEITAIVINNLIPGTLYTSFVVRAFANNISSQSTQVPENSTTPNRPSSVIVKNAGTTNITVLVIHGGGNVQQFLVSSVDNDTQLFQASTTRNFTSLVIKNLCPGTMYNSLTVTSISYKLESVPFKIPANSTVPSKPHNVEVSNITTTNITLNVMPGEGSIDHYIVYNITKNDDNLITTDNSTMISITKLTPGFSYDLVIMAVFNDKTSNPFYVMTITTKPAKFTIDIRDVTTKNIILSIKPPEGRIDIYRIKGDSIERLPVYKNVTGNTTIVIDKLTPGTLYSNFSILGISGNTSGDPVPVQDQATRPSMPTNTRILSITTTTIKLRVTHGYGFAEFYNIFDGTTLNKTTEVTSGGFTDIELINLTPGQLYTHLSVAARSHGLLSDHININKTATYPTVPTTSFLSQTTTTFNIGVVKSDGLVQTFKSYINGNKDVQEFQRSGERQIVTLLNLTAGEKYEVKFTAISNGKESNHTESIVNSTYPNKPQNVSVITQNTQSISINIYPGIGKTQNFTVYLNDTFYRTIPSLKRERARMVVDNLLPGTMHTLKVEALSNNLTSQDCIQLKHATNPWQPSLNITTSTEKTISFEITKGKGNVLKYHLSAKESQKDNCYTGHDISNVTVVNDGPQPTRSGTIPLLTAGKKYLISAFSESYESLNSSVISKPFHTVPNPPSKVIIEKTDVRSLTIRITKGAGCVKKYRIHVGSIMHEVNASSAGNDTSFTISNLNPGSQFNIKVSAVSNTFTNDDVLSFKTTGTTDKDPVPIALGAIGGLVAASLIIFLVVARRKEMMCFQSKSSTEILVGRPNKGFEEEPDVEMSDSRRKRPVALSEISSYIDQLLKDSSKDLSQEFKDLNTLSPKHDVTSSQMQENRQKNRYTNILPYDHSIVKLRPIEDEPGSDFINANYIPGYNSPREYIATQGPFLSTANDFWRMIWEQNVSIIVMLTQLMERGRKKCDIYWPVNLCEPSFFGDIVVEITSESHLSDHTLRIITLAWGDVVKKVRHYNYLAWPDMGTPSTTQGMMDFVTSIRNESRKTQSGPLVVHCSAGVGRTGTYIALDILLQELKFKQPSSIDIFDTILKLREHRLNMVQTEDQYVFIFKCVRDFTLTPAVDPRMEDEESPYENLPYGSQGGENPYANM